MLLDGLLSPQMTTLKTLAIMQPYFLPYLGYFQLMHTASVFVIYDDVTYIKKGWINRNRLLVNNEPWLFTVPLKNASQNVLIKDLQIGDNIIPWKDRFLKTVRRAYGKAPYFEQVYSVVENSVSHKSRYFVDWIIHSLEMISQLLSIKTTLKRSSCIPSSSHHRGQKRILNLCKAENAVRYLNAMNGTGLYDKATFRNEGIDLFFVQPKYRYRQYGTVFIEHLSIVDVLMFNGPKGSIDLLAAHTLT